MAKQKALFKTQRIKRKGRYYQVIRDAKGRFVKFQKWKPIKRRMWRIGVYINWVYHHDYNASKAITFLARKPTKEKLEQILEELRRLAIEEAERQMGYSIDEMRASGAIAEADPEIEAFEGIEMEQVEYDLDLIGETVVKTEHVKTKWRIGKKKHR